MPDRPVLVAYHWGGKLDPDLASRVELVRVQGAPFASQYAREGAGVVRPFAALHPGRRVILLGFSEGVQAVRAHLRDGAALSSGRLVGVVALDGAHASSPPVEASQLAPWRALHRSHVPWVMTSSRIVPPGYLSTREVLRLLGAPTIDGRHKVGAGAGAVWNTAGADGAEHIRHAGLASEAVRHVLDGAPPAAGAAPLLALGLVAAAIWARLRGWW